MIFPGFEAYTDVTCLQVIAKKEVIAKNRGKEGGGGSAFPCIRLCNKCFEDY